MQTINRAISILKILSIYEDGIGVQEISDRINLPLSTTYRILDSLKKHGYVTQNKIDKRYKLGMGILELASNMLSNININKIARPIMEELSAKYQKLIFLSVLENHKVICIDMVNNTNTGVRYYVKIGSIMPSYCAASGKSIAAYQDFEYKIEMLEATEKIKYTQYTNLDNEKSLEGFLEVAKNGYSVCDEEMELGVKAISTPIFDNFGRANYSLTVMKVNDSDDESTIIEDMKNASQEIGKYIGLMS